MKASRTGSGLRLKLFGALSVGRLAAGRYRVEVAMLVDGEQKDQKADTLNVKGGGGGNSKPPAAVLRKMTERLREHVVSTRPRAERLIGVIVSLAL